MHRLQDNVICIEDFFLFTTQVKVCLPQRFNYSYICIFKTCKSLFFFNLIIGDVKSDWMEDVDLRVRFGVEHAKSRGMVSPGDPIIVITGWQKGSGFTNTMRIIYVNGNK